MDPAADGTAVPTPILIVAASDDAMLEAHGTGLADLHALLVGAGFSVLKERVRGRVLERVRSERPVLVLLAGDGPEAVALCAGLKAAAATRLTPVVLLCDSPDAALRLAAIRAGADDILEWPLQGEPTRARVEALVRAKLYTDGLADAQHLLFELAEGIEARDRRTAGHCRRIAELAVRLAQRLGLDGEAQEALRQAGYLHDLGKLMVPEAILNKVGPFEAGEWEIMRRHPLDGERLCAPFRSLGPVLPIIRHHHERQDGSGYPEGLRGDAIPMTARILQVVDVYDALVQARPYKPALGPSDALAVLHDEVQRGFWDPQVFAALCAEVGEPAPALHLPPHAAALRR